MAGDTRREPAFEVESEAYDLYRRGCSFLRAHHPGQAVMLLERALQIEPGRNSIREALGRAWFALARPERASEQFAAVVEAVPTNDYAHYCLARCLLALGRPDEARAHLRLARALKPGSDVYCRALDELEET